MLAEATVRVLLDLLRFRDDLQKEVGKAADQAGRQFDREMRSQLRNTGRGAATEFGTAARTTMGRAGANAARDFETSFRQSLTRFSSSVGQSLSRQLRVSVGRAGIEAGRTFCDNLGTSLANCGRIIGNQVGRDINTALGRSMAGSSGTLGNALTDGAAPAARRAGRNAGREFSISFGLGTARAGRPVLAAFALLGSEIATNLGPALPVVAGLAPLLTGATAAALIARTAFQGVGDGIKLALDQTASLDDIRVGMEKLSPAARSMVDEFRRARPELTELRQSLQEAFFQRTAGAVTQLARTFSGTLRPSINLVSSSLGNLARTTINALTSPAGAEGLNRTLRGTSGFLDELSRGWRSVLTGFLAFSGAAGPGMTSIGRAIGDMLRTFGDFLSRAAASGDALLWVESGLNGMRELVRTTLEIGEAFITLLQAAQPIAMVMSGIFGLVINLVNAFGELPGPIQTAALAALLFARSGMGETLRNIGERVAPVRDGLNRMADAYNSTVLAARNSGTAQLAAARASQATSRALSGVATGFLAVGRGIRDTAFAARTLVPPLGAVTTYLARAGQASSTAATGLSTVAAQSAFVATSWRGGLIPATLAFNQALTRAYVGTRFFVAAIGDRTVRAVNAANNALRLVATEGLPGVAAQARITAANISTSLQTGFIRATSAVAGALGPVNAFNRAVDSARASAVSFGSSVANAVVTPVNNARDAYRQTSETLRQFNANQQSVNATVGATSTALGRARTAFSSLTTTVQASGAALRAGFDAPIRGAMTTLSALGTAATATGTAVRAGLDASVRTAAAALSGLSTQAVATGRAVASGLTNAVSGLVGALGGPWGLAIAGAGIALSLLASRQDEARKAAAQHDAAVARLADTLDRQTGAVTQSTAAHVASELAKSDAGKAANRLGIDLGLVTAASLGNASAQSQLRQELTRTGTETLRTSDSFSQSRRVAEELGLSLDDISSAARGSAGAQDRLRAAMQRQGLSSVEARDHLDQLLISARLAMKDQDLVGAAFESTAGSIASEAKAIREAVAAAEKAGGPTAEMSNALGILGSNAADADAKVAALTRALDLLAGDTNSAAEAQANFTDVIGGVLDGLNKTSTDLGGTGKAFIDASGKIDTMTDQGAFLTKTFGNVRQALNESAIATIEAGQKTGDLKGAYERVTADVNRARDAFIKQAMAIGATEAQANAAANALGLIPGNYIALVGTAGTGAGTLKDVDQIKKALAALPPNTPVRVQALTAEAHKALTDLNYRVVTMPNGEVTITANRRPADQTINELIRDNSGKVITVKVVVNGAVDALKFSPTKIASAKGNILRYADGGMFEPLASNRATRVKPNTWRIIGDRPVGDEAFIPINRSRRSIDLLRQTARDMGFELMAAGGTLGRRLRGLGAGVNVAPGAIMVNAPFADAELVARKTLAALARAAEV